MNLDITKFKAISLSSGTIYIGYSDKNLSIGFLRLKPYSWLSTHHRPVEEQLVQVEGKSNIILFDKNKKITHEVVLERGDNLKIPANQYHQHTNKEDCESLTSWRFDGDITEIISKITEL